MASALRNSRSTGKNVIKIYSMEKILHLNKIF